MKKFYLITLAIFTSFFSFASPINSSRPGSTQNMWTWSSYQSGDTTKGRQQKFPGHKINVTDLDVANSFGDNNIVDTTSTTTLPGKFVGYNASLLNSKVLVQWSTTEEVNADFYEVERSEDGINWNTIAYVAAIGNYNSVNEYSYNDKRPVSAITYYRVKQPGIDGKFVYTLTNLVMVNQKKTSEAAIIVFSNKTASITLPKTVKNNINIQVVSLSGQIISNQIIAKPQGQIMVNNLASLKGNYIIVASDGHNFKIAQQIIL